MLKYVAGLAALCAAFAVQASTFTVEALKAADVTDTSALIQWNVVPVGNSTLTWQAQDADPFDTVITTPLSEPVAQSHMLEGLEPGTEYAYTVDVDGGGVSEVLTFQTAMPPAPDFEVLSSEIVVDRVRDNGARITFPFSEVAQGQLRWWVADAEDAATLTTREESFNYATHRQTIRNAPPGSTINVQALGENVLGAETVSEIVSFQTAADTGRLSAKSEIAEPVNPLAGQQFSGLFLGSQAIGATTGNGRQGTMHAIRIPVHRSGEVSAAGYNNRTLQTATIHGRCNGSSTNRWCKCKNAGLDGKTCAYTLGNSYSVGNGGRIHIELRTINGKGEPDMSAAGLLGTTESFVPHNHTSEDWKFLQFQGDKPVLEPGAYFMVFVNTNTGGKCGYTGQSIAKAKTCPSNSGVISLNGQYYPGMTATDGGGKFGPLQGDVPKYLFRFGTGAWQTDPDNYPYWNLRFTEDEGRGRDIGNMYAAYRSSWNATGGDKSQIRKIIGGADRARQAFKPEHDFPTNGVWVLHGHRGTVSGNLRVELKDAKGKVLADGAIGKHKATSDCANRGSSDLTKMCQVWQYVSFDGPVEMQAGDQYYLELSGGSGFQLTTYFSQDRDQFANIEFADGWGPSSSSSGNPKGAHAQWSSNGGKSWRSWVGNYYSDRDLSVMFTRVGGPKVMQYAW